MFKVSKQNTLLLALALLVSTLTVYPDIDPKYKEEGKKDGAKVQRQARGYFDLQQNSISNLQFYTTNYGIFGLNIGQGNGGGYWPRGSLNQYIFGGGIWFGAQKYRPNTDILRKYVEVTYNPNNGRSWMVPGRISEGDEAELNEVTKYRTYFSTDFRKNDGVAINSNDGENWPVWDASTRDEDTLKVDRYFGYYIQDNKDRNLDIYKKGPAFISGEDIFCTYKDTDLNYYDGGFAIRKEQGYPLGIQYEQTIYSWGFGDYKDFVFLSYNLINMSPDTLWECWMSPVMDVDIARAPLTTSGAANDRVSYYFSDTTLNLAYQWTNGDRGEAGNGFGYLGFDFLESPAVIEDRDSEGNLIVTDSTSFVRRDSAFYDNSLQLGLVTFRNWSITDDKLEDEVRYNYMNEGVLDGDTGPGDKRFLMATGPFNMRPNDTVRVVVGIILASPSVKADADGSEEDAAGLVARDKFAQTVYDNNFRAPVPPERAIITSWEPLNHGVKIKWDSTSELSIDDIEDGLDFLGYRLYRARRPNLDTFDVDEVFADRDYPGGKGPFGWKQIAEWSLPTPYRKSIYRSGEPNAAEDVNNPFIDSLRVVGPVWDAQNNRLDTNAIRVMKVGKGVVLYPDSVVAYTTKQPGFLFSNIRNQVPPVISSIDTSILNQPWGPYYDTLYNKINDETYRSFLHYDEGRRTELLDSVFVGILKIDPALQPYNPMYFRRVAMSITRSYYDKLIDDGFNGIIYTKRQKDTVVLNEDGTPQLDEFGNEIRDTFDVFVPPIDSVYFLNTLRPSSSGGFVVDAFVPRSQNTFMSDTSHINEVLDSVYSFIKQKKAVMDFPQFEGSDKVRQGIVPAYMDRITNGRQFVDIGDDNRDGDIAFNEDPKVTEMLINNIPYYYKLLAYDEGDFVDPTPSKLNDGFDGLSNFAETSPRASKVIENLDFEITYVDSNRIGGLYNFNFFAIDQDRAYQNFNGHELELEFQPYWNLSTITFSRGGEEGTDFDFGLYSRQLVLRDLTTGEELFNGRTWLEAQPCRISFREGFTENGASWVLTDTLIYDEVSGELVTFGLPRERDIDVRQGTFTTGNFDEAGFCYSPAMNPPAYGAIGFNFDFYLEQYAGMYRPDSTTGKFEGVDASTLLTFIDVPTPSSKRILTTQMVDYTFYNREFNTIQGEPLYGSFNNGPAQYLVEFLPGGDTTMTLTYENGLRTATFDVPYLNLRVTNLVNMERPSETGSPIIVDYPGEVPHMFIDTVPERPIFAQASEDAFLYERNERYYPDPRNLPFHGISTNEFIDKYNIAAYGWINGRQSSSGLDLPKQAARPSSGALRNKEKTFTGFQGKYFLTSLSREMNPQGVPDTLDFTHLVNASGVFFALDYANKGLPFPKETIIKWLRDKDYTYGPDFEAGDKVMLNTYGGALGLPLPGAKVRVRIGKEEEEEKKYTDDMMDEIKVVPNPYYISHQGQKSPYDAKLYITRLPKRATINIYTITGDLIQTIEHDEYTAPEPDRQSIEVWNLLTKNGLRSQSQTLVAHITTPEGTETLQKFTIVVGGFRLITETD